MDVDYVAHWPPQQTKTPLTSSTTYRRTMSECGESLWLRGRKEPSAAENKPQSQTLERVSARGTTFNKDSQRWAEITTTSICKDMGHKLLIHWLNRECIILWCILSGGYEILVTFHSPKTFQVKLAVENVTCLHRLMDSRSPAPLNLQSDPQLLLLDWPSVSSCSGQEFCLTSISLSLIYTSLCLHHFSSLLSAHFTVMNNNQSRTCEPELMLVTAAAPVQRKQPEVI